MKLQFARSSHHTPPHMLVALNETPASVIAHFIALVVSSCAFAYALAINIYVVVALTDLQHDFMNPHDAARKINRLLTSEIIAHATGCAFGFVSGHWVIAFANVPLVAWHAKGWREKRLFMDVTEIFSAADDEKSRRMTKMAFMAATTLAMTFIVVRTAVMTLLTAAGREAAAKILREAAHSPMYHMF